jgi:hypothetical protein
MIGGLQDNSTIWTDGTIRDNLRLGAPDAAE